MKNDKFPHNICVNDVTRAVEHCTHANVVVGVFVVRIRWRDTNDNILIQQTFPRTSGTLAKCVRSNGACKRPHTEQHQRRPALLACARENHVFPCSSFANVFFGGCVHIGSHAEQAQRDLRSNAETRMFLQMFGVRR